MKLSKKEKLIASCSNPYYGCFATRDEVRQAKLKARGKYWNEPEWEDFVSFTPKGTRRFFEYTPNWLPEVRQASKLWAQGKTKEANKIYDACWENGVMWDSKTYGKKK